MYFKDLETNAREKAEYNRKHKEASADRLKKIAMRNKPQK